MGIKLDWDVESDDGWDEISEDPVAVAVRQESRRRWLVAVLSLVLIVAGLIGGGIWRLRLVETERRAELEATVIAETTALRVGDQRAFLDIQAPIDWWREVQVASFRRYQQGEATIGDVATLDVDLDRGIVILHEQRSEQQVLVTWFYQHSRDGWQHTAPTLEQWDEVQTSSAAFDIKYRTVDAAYVEQLAPRLDEWWVAAGQAIEVTGTVPRPTVRIGALLETRWADYESWTLLIPSPQVGARPADGSLDASQMGEIADRLAERWASLAVETGGSLEPTPDLLWYEGELALWLRREMAPDLPTTLGGASTPLAQPLGSPFLDSMAETADMSLVSALTQALRASGQIVPAVESVLGVPANSLAVDWSSYFTYRLQAEAELVRGGAVAEVDRLYRDPNRSQRMQSVVFDYAVERTAIAETIDVVNTLPLNDLLLAEVRFVPQNWPTPQPIERVTYEPFRIADGRWVHTWLVVSDWGEMQTLETERLLIQFQALDAPTGNWLSGEMETLYARLTTLLQLEPDQQPDRVLLVITPLWDEFAISGDLFIRYRNDPWIIVTSSYARVWDGNQTPWESVYQPGASQMASLLVGQKIAPLSAQHPFAAAFAEWAVEEVTPGGYSITPVPQQQFTLGDNMTPESLWPDELERSGQVQRRYNPADYAAASALVEALVDTYGVEAVPILLANLPEATSLDDWLGMSVAGSVVDIEAAWRQHLDAANLEP